MLQETIDTQRDMLKAFLMAEIRGWTDAVADPAGAAALAVETYGKDLGLDLAGQTEQATAQNELIVTADTKANGLFTLTDELHRRRSSRALGDDRHHDHGRRAVRPVAARRGLRGEPGAEGADRG